MPRRWTQIVEDARSAAEAIRRAGRPLRIGEIADALRRRGRALTDKQVEITVARARDLGLLQRHGAHLWDVGPGVSVAAPRTSGGVGGATPELLVLCTRRMLELPPSTENNIVAKRLLDLVGQQLAAPAVGALGGAARTAGLAAVGPPGNGAAHDDDPEVQVLLSTLAR